MAGAAAEDELRAVLAACGCADLLDGTALTTPPAAAAAPPAAAAAAAAAAVVSADATAAAAARTVPDVICFGDSWTAGLVRAQREEERYSPFAASLQRALRDAAPSGATVGAVGLSGWTARQMADAVDPAECVDVFGKAAPGLVAALRGEGAPLNALHNQHLQGSAAAPPQPRATARVAVILAGINSFGGYPAESAASVFRDLVRLHAACWRMGVRTVAVGVARPWAGVDNDADIVAANAMLDAAAARLPQCMRFVAFPVAAAASFGSDRLHFAEEGYAALGEGLAEAVRLALL